MKISNGEIICYLKRVDYLVKVLHQNNVLKSPSRSLFFTEMMGVSPMMYKNWYNQGIRKIYKEHLLLLEEKYLDNPIANYSKE
jgi:hypothetical protein